MKPIYIDVCALSRPFDDQSFLRIRLETEALNLILSNIKEGKYAFVVSPVHSKEIEAIPEAHERIELQAILEILGKPTKVNLTKVREKAEELVKLNFGIADAAHVAFAEQANAEFVTCDDILIKKCSNHRIAVWCGSPVSFCEKEGLK